MVAHAPTAYQPRNSSMDNLYGALLRPAWPYLEARRRRTWVRQLPNSLTTIRMVLAWPVAFQLGKAVKSDSGAWTMTVWILAVVALFASDGLDGTLANRLRITTGYGRIADPIADKVLVFGLMVVFVETGVQLLPTNLSTALIILVVIRVAIDAALIAVTLAEAVKKRRPKAEKWGKRKLATDALTTVLLTGGLWLASSHYPRPGNTLVAGGCALLSVAAYLGVRSIHGHWLNLRGTATAP